MRARARLLLCLLLGAAMAAAQLQKDEAVEPETVPGEGKKEAPEVELDPRAAIRLLNHEEFKQRKAAQDSLLKWGAGELDKGIEFLYEVYRRSDDPEVRLRSREVLKRLVIIKQPFDGEGYLGIQMDTRQVQVKLEDGELHPAVRITQVREGTAAEVAKLQANDLITGVDRVVFNDPAPNRVLADYIKSKKPGDIITLHVRRGEEALDLKASLRRRSPLLNQLTQWGTQLQLPAQAELDESDFQDWLRTRVTREGKAGKGPKPPNPAP